MTVRDRERRGRTVTQLLLRAALGPTFIAHGVKHARSLDGTAAWFESIGFRQPQLQARASAAVEIGAGAALVAGFGTPLAAAAAVGTMGVAAWSVHRPNGFFITKEGWEYVLNLAVAAIGLAGLGPGPFSVDRALGLEDRVGGPTAVRIAAGVGLSAAAAQLLIFWRRPEAKPQS